MGKHAGKNEYEKPELISFKVTTSKGGQTSCSNGSGDGGNCYSGNAPGYACTGGNGVG